MKTRGREQGASCTRACAWDRGAHQAQAGDLQGFTVLLAPGPHLV